MSRSGKIAIGLVVTLLIIVVGFLKVFPENEYRIRGTVLSRTQESFALESDWKHSEVDTSPYADYYIVRLKGVDDLRDNAGQPIPQNEIRVGDEVEVVCKSRSKNPFSNDDVKAPIWIQVKNSK